MENLLNNHCSDTFIYKPTSLLQVVITKSCIDIASLGLIFLHNKALINFST